MRVRCVCAGQGASFTPAAALRALPKILDFKGFLGQVETFLQKNAEISKNELDVRAAFVYTDLTPCYRAARKKDGRLKQAESLTAGRGSFSRHGLSVMLMVAERQPPAVTTLPGGSIGEDKEREGKGRDACRGPCRDAS